jgi:hypothetical protein
MQFSFCFLAFFQELLFRPSHSWISHLLTSSLSVGISSLFCRAAQCM